MPDVNENEIPFLLYSEQMDYLSDLAFNLKNDNFRLPIINKQLIEMKLLFIFRYEFKYGNKIYPFEYKLIYKKYNELKIERDLRNYLIN